MPQSYNTRRDLLLNNLKMLPPTELHYYFALLVASIENESNREKYVHLIDNANIAVEQLNKFYGDVNNQGKADLEPVLNAINALIISSKTQNISHKIKKAILAVCSVLLGLVIGTVGAAVGFLGGLLSDYTIIGNIRSSGFGFLTGMLIGAFIGSRTIDLIFQSSFERKLEFCMMHLHKVGKELLSKKTYQEYEAQTKQFVLDTFFKETPEAEKEAAFNAFLSSTKEQFQVSTTTAGFVSSALKGHVGHHTLIAYSINGKYHIPMEFGIKAKKTPSFFDQNESKRVVTGKKLFDMLVLNNILQETYEYTFKGILIDYDLGSNDCRTYVDKLLIGTNQAPTRLPRFNSKIDKFTGNYIIGPIVRFFSKTNEMEMAPLIPHYKADPNEPDPVLTERKWTGRKKEARIVEEASDLPTVRV